MRMRTAVAACRVCAIAAAACAGILGAASALDPPKSDRQAACFATICSDRPLVAGGEATLSIRVEALGRGLAAGDTLDLHPPFCAPYYRFRWSAFQLDDENSEGWIAVRGNASAEIVKHPREPLCQDYPVRAVYFLPRILRLVLEKPLPAGEGIDILYGQPGPAGKGLARVQLFPEDDTSFPLYLRPASGEERTPVPFRGDPLTVARAGPERLHLAGPSDVSAMGGATFQVAALDRWGFPAEHCPPEVEVLALHESGRLWGPLPLAATPKDRAVREIRDIVFPETGVWWLAVSGAGLESGWELPVLVGVPPERRLFWGDLHWHSKQSDGSRSPRDGFLYARDVVGLDFTAKTDHDFVTASPCLGEAEWEETVRLTEEFNEPGRFATLLGWEYTYGDGHQNVYFRDKGRYEPLSVRASPEELWSVLAPGEAITVPHHPAGGIHVPNMNWKHRDPRFIKVVEVFSQHGNAETPLAPLGPRSRGETREDRRPRRGSVQEAMSLGLVFSLLASTDNHTATPGNPVQHARIDLPAGTGLCAVWLEELHREKIFDAIVAGDTYGTTGPRIRVEFRPRDRAEGEAGVEGQVIGAAALAAVELVGVCHDIEPPFPVLASFECEGRICRFHWQPAPGDERYRAVYLRVTQTDEEMAWSSPLAP